MKQNMMKLLSLLTCGVLAVGLFGCQNNTPATSSSSVNSSSSEEMVKSEPTEGVLYSLSEDGAYAIVNGYEGTAADVVIADTFEGKPVVVIAEGAFAYCEILASITIPDSVTSIGAAAFLGCDDMISITIPASVTSIGGNALLNNNLTNIEVAENNPAYMDIDGNLYSKDGTVLIQYAIGKTDTSFTLPDTVTTIGDYAFAWGGNLKNVTIPNTLTAIGVSAFAWCYGLTDVTIPDSVTSIGDMAFYICESLTEIEFEGTMEQWNAIGYQEWTNVPAEKIICRDGDVEI